MKHKLLVCLFVICALIIAFVKPGTTGTFNFVTGTYPAARAYDFINYQGINYQNQTTTPGTDIDAIAAKLYLSQVLIKHVRLNFGDFGTQVGNTQNTFASVGIDGDCLTRYNVTAAAFQSFAASLTNGCSSAEMPNEPNSSGTDPNWLTDIPKLAAAYKAAGITPIYGPSIIPNYSNGSLPNAEQSMAPLAFPTASPPAPIIANSINYVNTHPYEQEYNPETNGFGGYFSSGCGVSPFTSPCGNANSLTWYVNESQVLAEGLPTVATEGISSYGSYPNICPTHVNVDLPTQQAYFQRGLLYGWLFGLKRVFPYKLTDDGGCSDGFGTFGLLNRITNGVGGNGLGTTTSINPKQSFTALAYMNHILQDTGGTAATFTPLPLNMITIASSDVLSLLLEMSDGSYRYILWSQSPLYDTTNNVELSLVSDAVTMNFTTSVTYSIYTQSSSNGVWNKSSNSTGTSISTTVNQYPEIVDIVPNAVSATPVPIPTGISTPGPAETP